MFHTRENFTGMVLSTIVVRPPVVKHDLPGRVVTVTWVVHYVGSHSRLRIPSPNMGGCSLLLRCGKPARHVTSFV
jgi:hypothetical protein